MGGRAAKRRQVGRGGHRHFSSRVVVLRSGQRQQGVRDDLDRQV